MMVAVFLGEWWDSVFEVARDAAPALLIVLGALLSLLGATVAGRVEFVRERRAKIIAETLPPLHDLVNDLIHHRTEGILAKRRLSAQPDSIHHAYVALHRDAVVAGRKDLERASAFHPIWQEIGWLGEQAAEDIERLEKVLPAGAAYARARRRWFSAQLNAWQQLLRALDSYEEWLRWKSTKRWFDVRWWHHRPAPPFMKVAR